MSKSASFSIDDAFQESEEDKVNIYLCINIRVLYRER